MPIRNIIVGISGASGAVYAKRLITCLCASGAHAHLVVSPNGQRLLHDELGIRTASAETLLDGSPGRLTVHPYKDIGAVLASGSFHTQGMVICPCSTNTMAAVAAGLGDNLLNRAAAVTLKEARRLVLVPREMPFTQIDLENALRLSRAGAIICPASPGFYLMPKSIDDLVDFVVGKVLDLLEIPHDLSIRWAEHLDAAHTRAEGRPGP